MSGYFDLADETASVFVDGWYRSGDLADMDDEGYLRITGRRREIIRSGGETVAPSEVEAAIASFPGVREVGVVGLPDQSWGEIVCAVVVLDEGAPMPAVESLRAYLGSGLATFAAGSPRGRTTPHGGHRADPAGSSAAVVARPTRSGLTPILICARLLLQQVVEDSGWRVV
jgi:acyl-CoA synthetase (AMP-forming)/AMP-acid ligase II